MLRFTLLLASAAAVTLKKDQFNANLVQTLEDEYDQACMDDPECYANYMEQLEGGQDGSGHYDYNDTTTGGCMYDDPNCHDGGQYSYDDTTTGGGQHHYDDTTTGGGHYDYNDTTTGGCMYDDPNCYDGGQNDTYHGDEHHYDDGNGTYHYDDHHYDPNNGTDGHYYGDDNGTYHDDGHYYGDDNGTYHDDGHYGNGSDYHYNDTNYGNETDHHDEGHHGTGHDLAKQFKKSDCAEFLIGVAKEIGIPIDGPKMKEKMDMYNITDEQDAAVDAAMEKMAECAAKLVSKIPDDFENISCEKFKEVGDEFGFGKMDGTHAAMAAKELGLSQEQMELIPTIDARCDQGQGQP